MMARIVAPALAARQLRPRGLPPAHVDLPAGRDADYLGMGCARRTGTG